MKLNVAILLLGIAFASTSCLQQQENSIKSTVKAYYETYQERSDFQKFLSFYDEQIVLKDVISGEIKTGKKEFATFFDWENPAFSTTENATLIVTSQVVEKNKAITEGYFTSFKWDDIEVEAMYFVTILTFNEAGKIIGHTDWINYPSTLLDYQNRKNANKWINH